MFFLPNEVFSPSDLENWNQTLMKIQGQQLKYIFYIIDLSWWVNESLQFDSGIIFHFVVSLLDLDLCVS